MPDLKTLLSIYPVLYTVSLWTSHIFHTTMGTKKSYNFLSCGAFFSMLPHVFSPKNILPVNGWHKHNWWWDVERQFQCKWASSQQDFKCSSFLVSVINDRLLWSVISVYIEECCASVKSVHISGILRCSKVTLKKLKGCVQHSLLISLWHLWSSHAAFSAAPFPQKHEKSMGMGYHIVLFSLHSFFFFFLEDSTYAYPGYKIIWRKQWLCKNKLCIRPNGDESLIIAWNQTAFKVAHLKWQMSHWEPNSLSFVKTTFY